MTLPQAGAAPMTPVDDPAGSSTATACPNHNAAMPTPSFSTIHTVYYYCWSFSLYSKK
jgi:hypothetical protein